MKKTLLTIIMISGILVTACSKKDDGGGVQATGPAINNNGVWNTNCTQCATSVPNAGYLVSVNARHSIINSVPMFELAGSVYVTGGIAAGASINTYQGQGVMRANLRIRQQSTDYCNLPAGDYTGGSTAPGTYNAGSLSGFVLEFTQVGTGLRTQIGIAQAAIHWDQSLPQPEGIVNRGLGGALVVLSVNGQQCNRSFTAY